MEQAEDRAVVARVIAGETDAFRALIERHGARVHRLCVCLLHHQHDAEDAAQETFVRAYVALRRFDPAREFSTWLLTIAANRCRDRLRRRTRRPLSLDDARVSEPVALPPASGTDPWPDRSTLLRHVADAVAHLDGAYRAVFHLYHREGRSYAEIAAILGRPVGTVKTQLHRARRLICAAVERAMAGGTPAEGAGPPATGAPIPRVPRAGAAAGGH